MAAFETPWLQSMASPAKVPEPGSPKVVQDKNPPTIAPFSPNGPSSPGRQRKTVLVQQKSPLLVATPPQITRALAFSHPFLLPLNKLVGLITWSSGDPWESFLLVASFWAIVLYGDTVIRWAGPVLLVMGLIVGMYSRRYSPLSSTGLTGEKVKGHKRGESEGSMRHQKSLDEIVDTLNVFTSRCNILLDPLLQLTDFLSTQRTATSATTRPALTTLFLRILMITPLWIALTLSPLYIITSRRVILAVGTLGLSWHSRPARVSRTLLWRSLTVRYIISVVTGLSFLGSSSGSRTPPALPPRRRSQHDRAISIAKNEKESSGGVRFTFVVYENQRRWLGLGWTSSMFAYERAAWTDEHLQPSPPKDQFKLPDVEGGLAKWQWVPGSEWRIESSSKPSSSSSGKASNEGWIYYDNKWNDGRRQDGWGKYTRRRKWYRDAELVDVSQETATPTELPATEAKISRTQDQSIDSSSSMKDGQEASNGQVKRRSKRRSSRASAQSSAHSNRTLFSDEDQDHLSLEVPPRNEDWGVGDDIKMGLG